jgi:signal peptidase I
MPSSSRRQTLLVIAFLVVVVLFVTMFRMGVVRGTSMVPTYQDGQVVLVRRLHWFSPPLHRGDVVLLRQGRDVIIKRIYRLEGEEIDDSVAHVKSRALRSDLKDYYEQDPIQPAPGVVPRLTVPKGYVVVLGDNLRGSEDSRVFGPLPISNILGVVVNSPDPPYANAPAQ